MAEEIRSIAKGRTREISEVRFFAILEIVIRGINPATSPMITISQME